ncbi:PIN domain-containing protein [Candidatus Woesearchaeota archaeon]|nr:PIN domain-containing protein [Candidatus Woesearchaeota archaeon]
MTEPLFFDSYALIELINGNNNYEKYSNSIIVTTKLNLFELYYRFLLDFNKEIAAFFLNYYYGSIVDFDKQIIGDAAELKLAYKKQKLSMTDCIGYIIAKRMGIKFLTGDKEFENFDNVEFVK